MAPSRQSRGELLVASTSGSAQSKNALETQYPNPPKRQLGPPARAEPLTHSLCEGSAGVYKRKRKRQDACELQIPDISACAHANACKPPSAGDESEVQRSGAPLSTSPKEDARSQSGSTNPTEYSNKCISVHAATKCVGLPNHGQTCYQAAALQALGALDVLPGLLQRSQEQHHPAPLLNALSEVLHCLRDGYEEESDSVKTAQILHKDLLQCLHRIGSRFAATHSQHDAEEFMSFLLDSLPEASLVDSAIQLQQLTQRTCKACAWSSDAIITPARSLILPTSISGKQGSQTLESA